jgi:Cu2+-exporting ATPase
VRQTPIASLAADSKAMNTAALAASSEAPLDIGCGTRWSVDRPGTRCAESWLRLPDIYCATCVATIERALHDVDGVLAATVDLGARCASVRWDPARTSVPALFDAVRRAGYDAQPDPASAARALRRDARRRALRRACVAVVCIVPVALLAAAYLAPRIG